MRSAFWDNRVSVTSHYNDVLNLTPTTTISHGVLAAKHGQAATSRTVSLLSYAILLSGFLTLGVALYTVIINYSSLPFLDGWIQVEVAANGDSPFSPAWLWQQHSEHRLVIPKLFLAADLLLFQARQVFLLASILAIQLLHWGLLSWSMWVLGGWRGALWRTGAGLAAFCLFCPSQWQNLIWGFQVCFVLPQLLATVSFAALLLYWMGYAEQARRRMAEALEVARNCSKFDLAYALALEGLLNWWLREPKRSELAAAREALHRS